MDTIFALSSGRPPAGIAVIRISGPGAHDAAERIGGPLPPARTAALRELRHPEKGELLDQALVLRFDGPGTVRAWFIGMNPHLADDSPADAIREGRFQEALGAAKSFVAYGANYG